MIRHFTQRSLRPLSHNLLTTHTTSSSLTPSHLSHFTSRHFASFQIIVPNLGDSITEGTIAELTKAKGDAVETDEVIARLETDKVSIDVRSTGSGVISGVNVKQGDTVHVGDVLFEGDDAASGAQKPSADKAAAEQQQPKPEPTPAPTRTQAIDSAQHNQQQQPQQQQQQTQQQSQSQSSHDDSDDSQQQHRAHHPLIQFRHGRRPTQPNHPADARKQPRQVPASQLTKPAAHTQQQQQQQAASGGVRGMQPDAYFNQADFARVNEVAYEARQKLATVYKRKVWSEAEQEAIMMGGAPAYVPKALQKEQAKAAAAGGGKKK